MNKLTFKSKLHKFINESLMGRRLIECDCDCECESVQ